jgi:hypothetical protein
VVPSLGCTPQHDFLPAWLDVEGRRERAANRLQAGVKGARDRRLARELLRRQRVLATPLRVQEVAAQLIQARARIWYIKHERRKRARAMRSNAPPPPLYQRRTSESLVEVLAAHSAKPPAPPPGLPPGAKLPQRAAAAAAKPSATVRLRTLPAGALVGMLAGGRTSPPPARRAATLPSSRQVA